MDTKKEHSDMLELLLRPAFCVREGKITRLSRSAEGMLLSVGEPVDAMLSTGAEEYAAFQGGCLYLQLRIAGKELGATVTRLEDEDIFLLDTEEDAGALNALALAARELREPLSSMVAISESLLPSHLPDDPQVRELMGRISRSLYRMQRILGNMSDVGGHSPSPRLELRDIPRIFDAIFEKAAALVELAGARLQYTGIPDSLMGLIDAAVMERAVLNLLSNALRFLPGTGGTIEAKLSRRGEILVLSLQDNGSGIPEGLLGSLFSQYLRMPALEDRRHGLGLGLVIVRQAATSHGGTVLVDQGETGTRVTITMKLQKSAGSQVRSVMMNITGGRDTGLIELSEHLPVSVYEKEL